MKKSIFFLVIFVHSAIAQEIWKFKNDEKCFSDGNQLQFTIKECGSFFSKKNAYDYTGKFKDESITEINVKRISKFKGSDSLLIDIGEDNFRFVLGEYRKQVGNLFFEDKQYYLDLLAKTGTIRGTDITINTRHDEYTIKGVAINENLAKCLVFIQWYSKNKAEDDEEHHLNVHLQLMNSLN